MGNMHSATTLASMQSYFEKFGEVEHCYCAMKKETNKCKGYGFVAFRAAATADEVQRTRPHTLMVRGSPLPALCSLLSAP